MICEPSWENAAYLAWDVVSAAVPFVPGSYSGKAVKATSKVISHSDEVTDALRYSDELISVGNIRSTSSRFDFRNVFVERFFPTSKKNTLPFGNTNTFSPISNNVLNNTYLKPPSTNGPLNQSNLYDENISKLLCNKAPDYVTPGIGKLEGQYMNDFGRIEPWTAYYDEYGRNIARTDYNAGNAKENIPDVHYHLYEWIPGKQHHEYAAHVAGEYIP